MSAASVTLTVNGAAAAGATDGSTTRTDPGSNVTIALTTTTGIRRWILREDGTDYLLKKGFVVNGPDQGGTFSVTLTLPAMTCTIPLQSETWDGNQSVTQTFYLQNSPMAVGQYHRVDAVETTARTLTSATVTVDGLTLVQGQKILYVNQSTGAQNGIYTVGVVAGGNAAMTRSPDMASGAVLSTPQLVEVAPGGTSYGNTTWKTSNTTAITVGTTTPTFYPRYIRGSATLSGGAANVTSLWIQTGASSVATCSSAINAVRARVPTAGAGTGFALFDGTLTDGIQYLIINWG